VRVKTIEKLNCCREKDEQDFLFSTHDIVLCHGPNKSYKDLWMDTRLYLWFAKQNVMISDKFSHTVLED